MKILVFDINDTLITRKFIDLDTNHIKYKDHNKVGNYYVKLVPYFKEFVEFLNKNKYKIKVVGWTCMLRHNSIAFNNYLEKNNLFFDLLFCRDQCDKGEYYESAKNLYYKKDLNKVANYFNINVNDCILIDDNKRKRVKEQNFYLLNEAGLKELINNLDIYINK